MIDDGDGCVYNEYGVWKITFGAKSGFGTYRRIRVANNEEYISCYITSRCV